MQNEKYDLALLAKEAMQAKGLEPEFSRAVEQQLQTIDAPAQQPLKSEDLRHLLWCSIDNDDSKDLDQLTFAEKKTDGKTTLWIAVADVDALVSKDTPIDHHAQVNTTSVYTPAKIFPMLPPKLSTNLTSLNENTDRAAIVVKITMAQTGEIEDSTISQAIVHNYAQLAYNAVGAWLEGKGEIPNKIKQIQGLENVLRLQHEAAQILKKRRHDLGALTLESSEPEAKLIDDKEVILQLPGRNYAHQLIEHFMIAANSAMARHFKEAKISSLRRVVRVPKRWDRIVEIANGLGESLPDAPDSKALDEFLIKRKHADPQVFPDLSLVIIKLLGSGEYVVENAGDDAIGHFGLALREYTHSTAPNRRFPDLISQRQYKAFLKNESSPYAQKELETLASHCTQQEDAAAKVERQMKKSAAAVLLSSHIGEAYDGIITGAAEKGTWVRIFNPPVEGKVVQGLKKFSVGDRVSVKLLNVDIPKGFIDFAAQ